MDKPYTVSGNEIELSNYKPNKTAYFITSALLFGTMLIPVIVILVVLSGGGRLSIGYFLNAAVFGFIAYYFYRIRTWNQYGKEQFKLQQNQFSYQPKAKNLSFKEHVFDMENLIISFTKLDEIIVFQDEETALAKLRLNPNGQIVETNIKTPYPVILELLELFGQWGIRVEGNFEDLHE